MDTITVAKSDHLENVVASSGDFVANGNLIFNNRNGFLRRLMIQAEKIYTGVGWNSLGLKQKCLKIPVLYLKSTGPVLLTKALLALCNGHPLIGHHRTCWNVTVLNYPSHVLWMIQVRPRYPCTRCPMFSV